MTTLRGRRVLVTGASSGIGEAVARAAVAAGARVALLARRADRVEALAAELGGSGGADTALAVPADVADPPALASAVDGVAQRWGGLDALVAAAGVLTLGSVADTDPEAWRAQLDVNVLGVLSSAHAALPHLGEGGNIVLVSSMSGRRVPSAAGGVYAATKAAVHAVGETLRMEVGERGVRVTTVSPGFVATDLGSADADRPDVAAFRDRMHAQGLTPEAVADAVLHVLGLPPEVTVVEYALVSTSQR
jgi:NADP-dependent 3-hydroxy acid dehydrogenase YdfG